MDFYDSDPPDPTGRRETKNRPAPDQKTRGKRKLDTLGEPYRRWGGLTVHVDLREGVSGPESPAHVKPRLLSVDQQSPNGHSSRQPETLYFPLDSCGRVSSLSLYVRVPTTDRVNG